MAALSEKASEWRKANPGKFTDIRAKINFELILNDLNHVIPIIDIGKVIILYSQFQH